MQKSGFIKDALQSHTIDSPYLGADNVEGMSLVLRRKEGQNQSFDPQLLSGQHATIRDTEKGRLNDNSTNVHVSHTLSLHILSLQ